MREIVKTLHIRDGVSKTFHIAEKEIILHVDTNNIPIKVDEKHRLELENMLEFAEDNADEYTEIIDVNVNGGAYPKQLGGPAQKIWEDSVGN